MTEVVVQQNWTKLASIVDMACRRLGLSVNHYFQLLLEFGKWELMQLKLDRSNEVKTELLPISDVNTVTLPSDAIDWTKIGLPCGQYVRTLGINGELSKIDRVVGQPEFSYSVSPSWLPNGVAIQNYGGGFEFGNYGGRALFGIGDGLPHEGHFQVRRCSTGLEILLDGNVTCPENQLYVEYITPGVSICGETIVDPYIADYVLKSILAIWEEERANPRSESAIARRKADQAYALTLVSGRTNSFTPQDLLIASRRGYRLTAHA